MPRLIGENLSSTKLADYGTRSSIIQVRRGEKDTGMTALAGLTQVQGQENISSMCQRSATRHLPPG